MQHNCANLAPRALLKAAHCPQLASDQYLIVKLHFKADSVSMASNYQVTIVVTYYGLASRENTAKVFDLQIN